ncbi:hypothetical protein [Snodgrassella sp. ESL0253]|uniref:hypothetical protein n=1 Tax=Snodgrassella sp. ESL0253 TaxID=2705031 RepID=UPI001582AD0F|nr:hypothetical protein [Snodgrassella sp. ESL0253]NUE67491.1 hypothetical protein [Snodgrassella sp. ESL0253]
MKRKINILLISIFCVGLSGCYEKGVRFWNGGPYISKAEHKAHEECFKELESIKEPKAYIGSKEMQDWLNKVYGPAERECMKRKGF